MSAEAAPTRVFAGIDEAGLGPLLGPLTLGWSAFRTPRGGIDLWSILSKVVTRDPRQDAERIVVADSKRVFSRNPRGARRLETTALCFLAQLDPEGRAPGSAAEVLASIPDALRLPAGVLERHPWYAALEERLPVHQEANSLELRSHLLRRELERCSVAVIDAGVRAVPAGALNDSFHKTENKAETAWQLTAGIVNHLWSSYAGEGLELFVDRLGGRRHYAGLLGGQFPGTRIRTLQESRGLAQYEVLGGERRMRVSFAERGEERSFAVALGSCLAKYGRELSMGAFNRYFETLQPGLRPTAGYTSDGRRWLEDAREALSRADLAPRVLVRER
jgi:ribonuclease HII